MSLTIAYSKMKMQNLVLINNDTYQRETVSERPIRQPLSRNNKVVCMCQKGISALVINWDPWLKDERPNE